MKTMKYTIAALLTASLLFSSCGSDFLDVDPTATITEDRINEIASESPEKLLEVVNPLVSGLYSSLIAYNTLNRTTVRHSDFGHTSVGLSSDLMVDDMVQYSNNYGWFYNWYDFSLRKDFEHVDVSFPWILYYKLIRSTNNILSRVNNPDIELAGLVHGRGQAFAMRAFAYYNLINLYADPYVGNEDGPGVPLVIETTTSAEIRNNPRAKISAIYTLILSDLHAAEIDLKNYTRTSKDAIDIKIVYGLLARTYLMQENWTEAARYAKLARQGYPLMGAVELHWSAAKYNTFLDLSNPEWMWGSDVTSTTRIATSGIVNFTSHISSVSYGYTTAGDMYKCIDASLYDDIPSTDARKGSFLDAATRIYSYDLPKYANVKFGRYNPATNDNYGDYVLMRSSEMYLIEAEALAMSSKPIDAQNLLFDFVSTRNPGYVKTSKTGKDLQDEIYFQRRIELWGEGFSYFDHKRLHKGIVRNYPGTNHRPDALFDHPAGADVFKFRIPSTEILYNAGITNADNNN